MILTRDMLFQIKLKEEKGIGLPGSGNASKHNSNKVQFMS